MKKILLIFLTFIILTGITLCYDMTVHAETVSLTINCANDIQALQAKKHSDDSTIFHFGLNIIHGDNVSKIYSDSTESSGDFVNSVSFTYEKGASVTLTVSVLADASYTWPYDTRVRLSNESLNYGGGLTGTMDNSTQIKISGNITSNKTITIYGVSGDWTDVYDYSTTGTSTDTSTGVITEDNGRTVTKGTRYPGSSRTVAKNTTSSSNSNWTAFLRKLNNFKKLITISTNALLALAILTTILVFIIHAVQIQFMPSHPMQRRRSLENVMMVFICTALLGCIKLFTVLILGIAVGI